MHPRPRRDCSTPRRSPAAATDSSETPAKWKPEELGFTYHTLAHERRTYTTDGRGPVEASSATTNGITYLERVHEIKRIAYLEQ